MKYIYLLLFFCFIGWNAEAQSKVYNYVTIKGIVTETSDYCGGAMPNEQVLEALKTPQPIAGKTIYIKIGSKNSEGKAIYKKLITDSAGCFKVRLKSGQTYCFVEEWKSKKFIIPKDTDEVKWDAECLRKRFQTADYLLTVKSSRNGMVKINFHNRCFYKPYCGEYTGPIPP
ncbi:MAG: hypothetical protein IPI46_03665 [Bacteroidetes bacterium]|nr:hypothetical protein [Bacteroidota bacterium]